MKLIRKNGVLGMVLCAVGLTACERAPMMTAFEADPAVALSTTRSSAVAVSNLTAASGKSYEAVRNGARSGEVRMTDRSFRLISGIPMEVRGATLIRTAYEDRNASPGSTSFLSFDVDDDVTVYVAHDSRVPRPSWLSGFVNTGLDLVDTDRQSGEFRLFEKDFAKGRVTLGSNVATAVNDASMYSVLVKPREASTGTTAEKGSGSNGGSHEEEQNDTVESAVTEDPQPTPPPASSSASNEPAGFTMINNQTWETAPWEPGNPWGGNDNGRSIIMKDPTAPKSDKMVFRATVPEGTDGSGSHNTWYVFPEEHQGYSELYFAAWYKFPVEWENHGGGTKQLWPGYDGVTNQLYTGFSRNEMRPHVNLQGQPWGNRNHKVNMGPASHRDLERWRDEWVRLEYYVKMNTTNSLDGDDGRADGIIRLWITAGGETHQIMNHEDVKFLSVDKDGNHWNPSFSHRASGTFTELKWNPTYGGMNDPAPYEMYNYTDNIYISGR